MVWGRPLLIWTSKWCGKDEFPIVYQHLQGYVLSHKIIQTLNFVMQAQGSGTACFPFLEVVMLLHGLWPRFREICPPNARDAQ